MQDCEWKIRKTEKACKDRMVEAERAREEALSQLHNIQEDMKKQLKEVSHIYFMHVQSDSSHLILYS